MRHISVAGVFTTFATAMVGCTFTGSLGGDAAGAWGADADAGPEGGVSVRPDAASIVPNDDASVVAPGVRVVASRLTGAVPLSIHFRHDGPATDTYAWNFGDGSARESGLVAAHVFERPGRYTIGVTRASSDGVATSTDRVEVEALPFSGVTIYVDPADGDDLNSGTDPASPARSLVPYRALLSQLRERGEPIRDVRVLFRRGTTYVASAGTGSALAFHFNGECAGLRFGAYARPDGSDDPTLPRPVLVEAPERGFGSPESDLFYAGNCEDLAIYDLTFAGNYDYRFGDFRNAGRGPSATRYPTAGISLIDVVHALVWRVEIRNLYFGLLFQRVSRNEYVHIDEAWIHDIGSTPLHGGVDGYALYRSTIERSANAHLHYVGASNAIVARNRFRRSGVSWPAGLPGIPGETAMWCQCNLRFDGAGDRIHVVDNDFGEASGSSLCFTHNEYATFPDDSMREVVIERNFVDGSLAPEVYAEMTDALPTFVPDPAERENITFCLRRLHVIGLTSVHDTIVRNNIIAEPRGPLAIVASSASATIPDAWRDVSILNNTFVTTSPADFAAVRVADAQPETRGLTIANNVFAGFAAPRFEFGFNPVTGLRADLVPAISIDHNLHSSDASVPAATVEQALGSVVPQAVDTWRARGWEQQSLFDPRTEVGRVNVEGTRHAPLLGPPEARRVGTRLPSVVDDFHTTVRHGDRATTPGACGE